MERTRVVVVKPDGVALCTNWKLRSSVSGHVADPPSVSLGTTLSVTGSTENTERPAGNKGQLALFCIHNARKPFVLCDKSFAARHVGAM